MRLHLHEAGDGDRVALLIHGVMSDHGTWHAVEAELITRGFRVIAPDLRGHGLSPRGDYTPEFFAADLVENLPTGADLAIGHSLGGLALALAVEQLRPVRAVYSDPALLLPVVPRELRGVLARVADEATAETIRAGNPRWSDADIAAEVAGFALFDRAAADVLVEAGGRDFMPERAVVPSLVQLADPSSLINAAAADRLRARGFQVETIPATGHCIHRDDLSAFLTSTLNFNAGHTAKSATEVRIDSDTPSIQH
ncbi:pimeloyl-ACP methyl ester carboxylesterase [Allocatelliglobosispora scoriae]|uniref:Pimeloyl-ACP methyl ester carboxylesterase n=1 Tax=Allocatelliglobosispora scoriae TaxID=643052 RepID=A0A841BVB2_9ACTN|nr:alpha/beta hydrolase [Allocatelliglobosispora scoriae]MBB5872134.1 pimeloyl-ACP methyl ester carboxylesterase [Allocatelliglobosispora scoriae]